MLITNNRRYSSQPRYSRNSKGLRNSVPGTGDGNPVMYFSLYHNIKEFHAEGIEQLKLSRSEQTSASVAIKKTHKHFVRRWGWTISGSLVMLMSWRVDYSHVGAWRVIKLFTCRMLSGAVTKVFTGITSLNLCYHSELGTLLSPIWHMRKLKPKATQTGQVRAGIGAHSLTHYVLCFSEIWWHDLRDWAVLSKDKQLMDVEDKAQPQAQAWFLDSTKIPTQNDSPGWQAPLLWPGWLIIWVQVLCVQH